MGVCRECGTPANQIDHINGSSPDLENLQLLCDPCHTKKTKSAMVPASNDQVAWIENLWETRIRAEVPTRLADHETDWDKQWRALKAQREHRLWEDLEEETGLTKDDFRGSGLKWPDIVAEAFDSDEIPGERYVEAFEAEMSFHRPRLKSLRSTGTSRTRWPRTTEPAWQAGSASSRWAYSWSWRMASTT